MSPPWQHAADLLRGPLLTAAGPWPLSLCVLLGDLRPRFLAKGQAGRGYRAVARNGRVLLAGDRPLADLAGRCVRLRLQTWHRTVLPGDRPKPHGLLLCVRSAAGQGPEFEARLARHGDGSADLALALDVGGGQALHFRRLRG
jgi:hypothetical protein